MRIYNVSNTRTEHTMLFSIFPHNTFIQFTLYHFKINWNVLVRVHDWWYCFLFIFLLFHLKTPKSRLDGIDSISIHFFFKYHFIYHLSILICDINIPLWIKRTMNQQVPDFLFFFCFHLTFSFFFIVFSKPVNCHTSKNDIRCIYMHLIIRFFFIELKIINHHWMQKMFENMDSMERNV